MKPAKAQEKMIEPMVKVIVNLVGEGSFNPKDIRQLAMPIRFGRGVAMIVKMLSKTGALNIYWDQWLKKNNAYEKRFDCLTLADKQV